MSSEVSNASSVVCADAGAIPSSASTVERSGALGDSERSSLNLNLASACDDDDEVDVMGLESRLRRCWEATDFLYEFGQLQAALQQRLA